MQNHGILANRVVSGEKDNMTLAVLEEWIPLCCYLELFLTVLLNNIPLVIDTTHAGISLRMCDQVQASLELSPVLPYQ